MAHGEVIYAPNGITAKDYRGWKALDASDDKDTGDSGWLDVFGMTKFSLELQGIVSGDKAKIFGTNMDSPQLSDAGVLIGSELTQNGFTQFTGTYAGLRIIHSADAGGGDVTALLHATK